MDDRTTLRRQDFWTAIVLIAASLFLLWRTSTIPFFEAAAAGVEGRWYNSAALVPYGIFSALLVLSVALLVTAVAQGGAPAAGLPAALRAWATSQAAGRMAAATAMMLLYIFGLVPRVDFVLCSALVLLAMLGGFHQMRARATLMALALVAVAALYAFVVNFPQSRWNGPHDDDWVTVLCFLGLAVAIPVEARLAGERPDGFLRWSPVLAVLVPLVLIMAMAFGFRQNVPNRGGLLFQQIEYHYFVTLRPWLQS